MLINVNYKSTEFYFILIFLLQAVTFWKFVSVLLYRKYKRHTQNYFRKHTMNLFANIQHNTATINPKYKARAPLEDERYGAVA